MNRLEVFHQHRSLLFAIAYRMLGSVTDAEDMLQEAWIRWQSTDAIVHSPPAFLSSLMTRLCIDYLRSARVKREQYVGVWLPEPLITEAIADRTDHAELAESLSFAFLTLLECLSPTERAVFLLRDVFHYDYADIAKTVGKSIPNCRQMVRRARQHLVLRQPRSSSTPQQKQELVEQFLTSWNQGDVQRLVALMAEDVTFWSDGGGEAIAAQHPLRGCQKVARFLVAIRRSRLIPTIQPHLAAINDQPGILNFVADKPQSTFSFEWSGATIQTIFAVVNPRKLTSARLPWRRLW